MRERAKEPATRFRHRRARMEAVAFYRRQFGDAEFLERYSGRRMALWGTPYPGWKPKAKSS